MDTEAFTNLLSALFDEKLGHLATKSDLVAFQNNIKALREENSKLRDEVRALQLDNNDLLQRVEDLEVSSRQNNLVFRGLKSDPNTAQLEEVVSAFCEEVLKISVLTNNLMVRPLGSKDNSTNPLLVTFSQPKDKLRVLQATKCLKSTGFAVHIDLPEAVRRSRVKLLLMKKEVTRLNKDLNVKLFGSTLRVGEETFRWSPVEGVISAGKAALEKLTGLIGVDLSKFHDDVKKGTLPKDYFSRTGRGSTTVPATLRSKTP